MIGKDQLVFDTSDAQSIADSDSVGAYLRSSDGTLIDHESVNAVDRLAVDATLKDGAGTALTSTLVGGKQALDVRVAEGINVEVDLDHTQDSVRLGDGTTLFTGTTVGPDTGLDVYILNTDLAINDAALADTAILTSAESLGVAGTAQNVVSSVLANRKYLYIRNESNKEMYIGPSGVTAANGFPLSAKAVAELRIGASVDVEFVGRAGETPDIRTMQLS